MGDHVDTDTGKSIEWAQGLCLPGCQVVNLGRRAGLFTVLDTWRTGDESRSG